MSSPGQPSGSPPEPPAWPVSRYLSPSKLKDYTTCPHRVRLQYVDQMPGRQEWSLIFEEGKVAHSMLADAARRLRARAPLRTGDDLLAWARRALPHHRFPSAAAHEASVRKVLRWVECGLNHLDPNATFLNIEHPGKRTFPLQSASARLTISTRPDLILLRTGEEGGPVIDIIDYKTGSVRVDLIAPITMRFVFKELLQKVSTDTLNLPVQFTYVFLEHDQLEVIPLTPGYCEAAWNDVLTVAEHLILEREWPARPSNFCHYCQYHEWHCTAREQQETHEGFHLPEGQGANVGFPDLASGLSDQW
jgi:hypothetical protein